MPREVPGPTTSRISTAEVFDDYLTYFRNCIVEGVNSLDVNEQRRSRLASGWTPLELLRHLTYVEKRWLEWGFLGMDIGDPWGDWVDGHWYVGPDETFSSLTSELLTQGERTRDIIGRTALSTKGQPGKRWEGNEPPTLDRILFHLLQEYARHAGHLDIVVELAKGEGTVN